MKQLPIKQTKGPIPFKGYVMNFYGTLLTREHPKTINWKILNHEGIHECQAEDFCKIKWIGYTLFYIVYFIKWLIRLLLFQPAYKRCSFEREAYKNDWDKSYQEKRKRWSWVEYITKKENYKVLLFYFILVQL